MAISNFLRNVIQAQLTRVFLIDSPQVTEAAMNVAYYYAMIVAANNDPVANADDQKDILECLENELAQHTETYTQLINENL